MKAEGRLSYLSAVCMGCLEGWTARLQCRNNNCSKVWDGSQLILGTIYSYDIFAAVPCCAERLKVSSASKWLLFPTKNIFSAILVVSWSSILSRDSTSSLTTVRQCRVLSAGCRTSTSSSLWSTPSWPGTTWASSSRTCPAARDIKEEATLVSMLSLLNWAGPG